MVALLRISYRVVTLPRIQIATIHHTLLLIINLLLLAFWGLAAVLIFGIFDVDFLIHR